MVFTTLIPTRLNDGQPVPQATIDAIVKRLWKRFGGCTIDGLVTGHWIDPATRKHVRDVSLKVTIACDSGRIKEAMTAVIAIGRRLQQCEMYFEVRDFGALNLKC